ncbi:hypothetical protein Goklo_001413 [Gossypium klotzschianum]|uniref:Uncharacterized protein n=1 Tax=Gossypium klotzschianum TaxID=34286 RepID=A0A7J8W0B0_9ROSI|nr:hypothetical protein [Gossypium klotzschianum]
MQSSEYGSRKRNEGRVIF